MHSDAVLCLLLALCVLVDIVTMQRSKLKESCITRFLMCWILSNFDAACAMQVPPAYAGNRAAALRDFCTAAVLKPVTLRSILATSLSEDTRTQESLSFAQREAYDIAGFGRLVQQFTAALLPDTHDHSDAPDHKLACASAACLADSISTAEKYALHACSLASSFCCQTFSSTSPKLIRTAVQALSVYGSACRALCSSSKRFRHSSCTPLGSAGDLARGRGLPGGAWAAAATPHHGQSCGDAARCLP